MKRPRRRVSLRQEQDAGADIEVAGACDGGEQLKRIGAIDAVGDPNAVEARILDTTRRGRHLTSSRRAGEHGAELDALNRHLRRPATMLQGRQRLLRLADAMDSQ